MSELYPGSYQYPAMLINKQPSNAEFDRMIASGNYLISRKYDGFWYQLEKIDEDHIYLFSRTKSRKTGELTEKIACVPHIEAWAKLLPNDTILVGEVYVEGGKSNNVTSIMGSLPEKAIARQFDTDEYGGPLHYYVHDVIRCSGEDLMDVPLEERIEKWLWYWLGDLFDGEEYIHAADYYCSKENDNVFSYVDFNQYLDDVFAAGGEGVVLKDRHGVYQPGKRPTYNKKIKTETTFDVIITGFVEPEKEYTGKEIETWPYWIEYSEVRSDNTVEEYRWSIEDALGEHGAYYQYKANPRWYLPVTKAYYYGWKAGIKVAAWDKGEDLSGLVQLGTISSGMTDFWRQDMAENPDKYLNTVVEIQAMSVDSKEHTIRHGRILNLREDKSEWDCTLDQIFS